MSQILIESQVLATAAPSITIGNGGTLSQSFKGLRIVLSLRGDSSGANFWGGFITYNNSTSGYSDVALYGANGTVYKFKQTTATEHGLYTVNLAPTTSNTFSNILIEYPNYTASGQKIMQYDAAAENNSADGRVYFYGGIWNSASAITSIKFTSGTGNFVAGSRVDVYGIK